MKRSAQSEPHEIVGRGVAHVPEGRKVFPRFTVLENLQIGGYTRAKNALGAELDFVYQMFPRLKERQNNTPARYPAASSRCSPSAAR